MSDDAILANSIWPNGIKVDADGHAVFYPLGTNKIEVPSEDEWPKGDILVSPFVYEDGLLVGFVDTKAMTVSGNTTITLPYSHIDADFSSIVQGDLIVNAPNADYKNFIWAVVAGEGGEGGVEINFKYKGCKTVDDVKAKDADYLTTDIVDGVWTESLADLEDGYPLFTSCTTIITFNSDLSSLTNAMSMFYECENLTTFNSDLSSLLYGSGMFTRCSNLTSFNSNLSSFIDGSGMFKQCSNLTTFNSNLSSMENGEEMFHNCTNLTTFNSDLSSLMFGYSMFTGCKLNSASVKNIIDTIKESYDTLTFGIGCNNTTADKDLFAQEIGYSDMTSLLAALRGKGWTVYAQYNGRPTTTYSLRQPAIEGELLPVLVKLEEVEEHADYTSMDETKKYRMTWFHETTGSTDGYTQYATLEEAIEALNIKPIER